MMNKLEELIDHLNAQPAAAEGFDARTLYTTGMQFGLTCKEIKDTFLGKEKALARGKYPASVSADVLKAAAEAPVKVTKPKAEKTVVVKKAAKKTASRNVSTAVVEKKVEKDEKVLAERRELIASIAKRHASEDKTIRELSVENKDKNPDADEDGMIEELEKLMKGSTVNPSIA